MTDRQQRIHIVGLYKSGTTWLLKMLAAHPQVIAWREFDPVRAALAPDRGAVAMPSLIVDYLHRRPTDPWLVRRERGRWRSVEEATRDLFLGRGWIPLMGESAQAAAAALPRDDPAALLDGLLALAGAKVRADDAPPLKGAEHPDVLGFRHHRRGDLLRLLRAVGDCRDTRDVPRLLYDGLAGQAEPDARVVFKAADQVMQLSALRDASPGARHVAVIRDGRDVAVSARHYEALMRERGAPFRVARAGALRRLLGWSVRAAKLAAHARRGDVLVLRYEDLHDDFGAACGALLRRLDLDDDASIIEEIARRTAFRTMSGGRSPGDGANEVLRKGVVGDWRSALDAPTRAAAWRLVGRELTTWGYTATGEVRPTPLAVAASDAFA